MNKQGKLFSVAIDGPSGAGKSTLARMTAKEFGFLYVDTGAIYRSVGLYVYRNGVDPQNAESVTALLGEINIELEYAGDGAQRMVLNGEDVSSDIRLPEISAYASKVSAIPAVRSFLLDMQRSMAKKYSVVMDGRDIGTVVLPDAELKIFLYATPEERAMRRHLEYREKGIETDYADVLSDMKERDKNDSSRSVAPLKAADDAVILDTTGFSLEKSFFEITKIVKAALELDKGK